MSDRELRLIVPGGRCAGCHEPAMYSETTGTVTRALCMRCAFAVPAVQGAYGPGAYGPGYEWQGGRSLMGGSRCRLSCPKPGGNGAWCTLSAGHAGLHENWTGSGGVPFAAWTPGGVTEFFGGMWLEPATTGRMGLYGPSYGWQGSGSPHCSQRSPAGASGSSWICNVRRGHDGLHEAYGSERLMAWEPGGTIVWERGGLGPNRDGWLVTT